MVSLGHNQVGLQNLINRHYWVEDSVTDGWLTSIKAATDLFYRAMVLTRGASDPGTGAALGGCSHCEIDHLACDSFGGRTWPTWVY